MKPEFQQAHKLVANAHTELYNRLANLQASAERTVDLETLADLAYTMREIETLLDDSRKQAKHLYEMLSQKISLLHFSAAQISGSLKAAPIKTYHCTVSPTVKMSASTPSAKSQPDEYAAFMRGLGATDEQIASDTLRPHWPSVTEWLSARLAQGHALPDGIELGQLRPVYSLVIRSNKPVSDIEPLAHVAPVGDSVPF